jgi:hypothetical protein
MKKIKTLAISAFFALTAVASQAQTVDEILTKYFANTGGKEKWAAIKSIKMTGKVKAQAMELPVVLLQGADGKTKMSANFQGKEFVQMAFDGTTAWSTNQMTMKAEKMEGEDAENIKQDAVADFPDPFIDYKVKGYKVELEGKETVEGTECFKIKLTKKPQKVEGKEEENVVTYFFDTQNYVPIMSRTMVKKGQMKGMSQESLFSDYQEVNGLMFPFTISYRMNGQTGQSITMEKIETNVTLDPKDFAFPESK